MLQRLIGAHADVATSSEPWILIPLLGSTKNVASFDRWNTLVSIGIENFSARLPGGFEEYRREMVGTALSLYQDATGGGEKYFLDKTPAYWYIVDEIIESFEDARFVFLWRNPLGIVTSCVETWEDGQWKLRNYRGDLFEGLPTLTRAYERHRDRVFSIRFEDIVGGDGTALPQLFSYLDLDWDPSLLSAFQDVELTGPLGDQTGVARYSGLSDVPLQKWRETICNPVRKAWCARYLEWLGADRLRVMGYDLATLRDELAETSTGTKNLRQDAASLGSLALREMLTAHRTERGSPSSCRQLLGSTTGNAND